MLFVFFVGGRGGGGVGGKKARWEEGSAKSKGRREEGLLHRCEMNRTIGVLVRKRVEKGRRKEEKEDGGTFCGRC